MNHEPVKMRASYNDSIYKRGSKYLIKRFTCPKCGKVVVLKSYNPGITNYTCNGTNVELIKESEK